MPRFPALSTSVFAVAAAVVGSLFVGNPVSSDVAMAASARPGRGLPNPTPTIIKPGVSAATQTEIRSEADWILTTQLADGAIAHYTDQSHIWPYVSNFAAWGLARAARVSGNSTYAAATWRWLSWYQAHQDGNGYVTDYTVSEGVETSTGDFDSTDAYAGTFLLATREVWRATGDRSRLRTLAGGIKAAVLAVESTQQPDGLTWAKPAYHAKYVMDQAEAYAGLIAASELATALGNPALATQAGNDAARLKVGFDTLWDPTAQLYHFAKNGDGTLAPTFWTSFYPDALSQTWAVAVGNGAAPSQALVPLDRANSLMSRFEGTWPNWSDPTSTAMYGTMVQPVGYWPAVGLGLLATGINSSAVQQGTALANKADSLGRPWPYTPAIAGQLIVLQSGKV